MTIQYAYLRVDGLDRLEKDSYHKHSELFRDLAKWNHDESYLELIPDKKPRPGARGMPKLTQILDIMDPEHVYMQTTYAVLSQVTHVRPGGQTRYFEMNGDELVLNPGRTDDGFGNLSLGALAFAVMAASWVFAHLTDDRDDMRVLDGYSDRLHIPIRYDGDWPAKDRAHPE